MGCDQCYFERKVHSRYKVIPPFLVAAESVPLVSAEEIVFRVVNICWGRRSIARFYDNAEKNGQNKKNFMVTALSKYGML